MYIRIVRSLVSSGIASVPSGTISWGDNDACVDYIIQGTEDDIPEDAAYAAKLDDAGIYSEVIQAPAGFVFPHHFGGWNPESWPHPGNP